MQHLLLTFVYFSGEWIVVFAGNRFIIVESSEVILSMPVDSSFNDFGCPIGVLSVTIFDFFLNDLLFLFPLFF